MTPGRVLVIKLGALGDFCYALGAMQAIRRHHRDASLVLLTRASCAQLARGSGLFEEVWIDTEPRAWDLPGLLALRRRLLDGRFGRIYDLQTSDRSGLYFRLMGPARRPEWSGIVRGCSHRHLYARPHRMHQVTRLAAQLAVAGIDRVDLPDLSFMQSDTGRFALPPDHVLLMPGSSPRGSHKRWPHYGALAGLLAERGLVPALVGTGEDRDALDRILDACPHAVNLAGRTGILDIAPLARTARACVGNDTGPLHFAALAGCPTIALFRADGSAEKAAPPTPQTTVLSAEPLADLAVETVATALFDALDRPRAPA